MKKEFHENIGLKEIESKLDEYETKIAREDKEWSYVIEVNGDVFKYEGSDEQVKIQCTKDLIITHNHPIDDDMNCSFWEDDFKFMKNNDFKELRLSNPDYIYTIKKLKNFDDKGYNNIYKEALGKVMMNETLEIHHEAMLILKDKGYVEYERRIRPNKK